MSVEISREIFQDIAARNLARDFDESAVGRAALIQQMDHAIDALGVEKFLTVARNLAYARGYTLTWTPPSPGTITDPRR